MQDMLDIDIRSEVATVVGGVNEFTSLMSDLPSLDILDNCANDQELAWFGGPKWAASLGTSNSDFYVDCSPCINPNYVHSSKGSESPLDIKMEAPLSPVPSLESISNSDNEMMPISNGVKSQLNLNTNFSIAQSLPRTASPRELKSHLTFSPVSLKVPVVQDVKKQSLLCQTQRAQVEVIKKDLNHEIRDEIKVLKPLGQTIRVNSPTTTSSTTGSNTIKLAAGIGGLTFANSLMYAKMKQSNASSNKMVQNAQHISSQYKRAASPHRTLVNQSAASPTLTHHHNHQAAHSLHHTAISGGGTHHIVNGQLHSQPQKVFARSIIVQTNKQTGQMVQQIIPASSTTSTTTTGHHNKHIKAKPGPSEFPKPAYSYSCLIAMALKNSRAGSLPVSEIYSFMCEHFPYFKTAASGWKNSVRHNLSLNKCFEKIEKPATNGGQRKGCLWAMNPLKIGKMDDEIQKWSRKDPMAIRKAMVFPENLEQLERGEMKHGSTSSDCEEGDDAEGADEEAEEAEELSDSEVEMDDSIVFQPAIAAVVVAANEEEVSMVEDDEEDELEGDDEDEEEEEEEDEEEDELDDDVHVKREFDLEVSIGKKTFFFKLFIFFINLI